MRFREIVMDGANGWRKSKLHDLTVKVDANGKQSVKVQLNEDEPSLRLYSRNNDFVFECIASDVQGSFDGDILLIPCDD